MKSGKKKKKKKKKKKQQQQQENKKKKRSNKHIIVSKVFRLSREKSVQSMCYKKIYIKVYLMHKTNHAKLIKRLRMDINSKWRQNSKWRRSQML